VFVHMIVGPMFANKTERLILEINREPYANRTVGCFKPMTDDRYARNKIVAHSGRSVDCTPIEFAEELLAYTDRYDTFVLDEVQFFDVGIVEAVRKLATAKKRVIGAGLNLDWMGRPFGFVGDLLAMAGRISLLDSHCSVCHALGTKTQKIAGENSTVDVGSGEKYEPRCCEHWKPEVE